MGDLPNRVALVYDRVNKWGGAERVLLALHELFPQAPLYTAVYNHQTAPWAQVFPQVIPSFLQKLPGAKSNHELYPWLTPIAFEQFDFKDYEMVISVTSADAKGIITHPSTFHLCYCLTPTRYLWSHYDQYRFELASASRVLTDPVFSYLQDWDLVASTRPDAMVAISNHVQKRIEDYYLRDSEVVYPPVAIPESQFDPPDVTDYFLWVGRLVAYKRAQIIVETFNDLKLPLVMVGMGRLAAKLQQLARDNIKLLGFLPEEELARYYQHARGLVFFHEEDFGIVPVEAMMHGTPVIGLNKGGVSETVISGTTGQLVNDSVDELKNVILNFDRESFNSEVIKAHAQRFSQQRFSQEFVKVATAAWRKYKITSMY